MKTKLILFIIPFTLTSCMFLNIPENFIRDIKAFDKENKSFNRNDVKYFSDSKAIGPYSTAIKIGDYIYLSGQIGVLKNDSTQNNSIEEETFQTLKNIDEVLKTFNCSIENVISCNVFLKDINDFQTMNTVYEKFFVKGKYPIRSTVEVSNLPKNAKIEISAIAFVGN